MKLSENLTLSRYDWAREVVEELLPVAPRSLVLDIGAGDGKMQDILAAIGARTSAFDLEPKRAAIASWDLKDPPRSAWELGGIALLLDVIEHCDNPWLSMQHISQMLLPGGYLVVTMPNPLWSRSRYYAFATGNLCCFTQSDLDLNHHVFTPWPHMLQKMLSDAGFDVIRYVTLDGKTKLPRPKVTWRYPLRLAFACANIAIERLDAAACGMSYGVVAIKRSSYERDS